MSQRGNDLRTKSQSLEEIERLRLRLQEAGENLEKSEARVRAIIQSSQDAVIITDDEGACVQANSATATVFGLSPEQLLGRRISDFAGEAIDLPAILRTLLATGRFRGEIPLIRADGQIHFVECDAVANIRPGRHLWVVRDVTERQEAQDAVEEANERLQIQAEKLETQTEELRVQTEELRVQTDELAAANAALSQSEERLRLAQQAGRVGVFDRDLQNNIAVWTRELEELFGIPVGTFEGKPEDWAKRVYPEDLPRMISFLQEWMQSARTEETWEYRFIRDDGQVRWMEGRGRIFRDPNGKPLRMIGTNMDITERKRAEEALRESEERYRRLFAEDLTGDFIATPDGKVIECNPAFAEIYGFADREQARQCDMSRFNPADWASLMARLRAECRVQGHQCVHRRPDGVEIHVVANVVGQFNDAAEITEVQGYIYDDTERKRAEDQLQEAHRRLNLHIDTSPLAVVEWDSDFHITRWAGEAAEIFGWTSEEVLGKRIDELPWVYEEDWPGVEQVMADMLSGRRPRNVNKNRNVRKDGTIIHCEWYNSAIRDASGRLVSVLSQVLDVTERNRAEEALRESEERLKRTQGIAHLGSWELDLVNNHLSWSDEVYRIFGLQPQEFHATYEAFLEAVHPDDRAAVDAAYSGSLREGRDTYEIEHRIVRRSTGEICIVHEKCQHLRDASGRIIRSVGMVHDITERKQAEEALRELNATLESKVAERTAELQYRARQLQRLTLELSETEDRERRQLAEILHDDLQQQLAAAKFHLTLLNNRAKHDPAQQAIVAQVDQILIEAIQKSRSLSHELSPAALYHGDFAGALTWLAGQMQTKHGLEVKVDAFGEVRVESEALKSFLYKAAQELLFNVVKHARVSEARIRVRRLGRCICLSVSDRGRGFDPQEVRQTAGFGLLSIRERVELLGGRMKVHSAKGHGSTFHVVVPDGTEEGEKVRTEEGRRLSPSHPPTFSPSGPPSASPLRVLLADDHEIVREGLISLLSDVRDIEVVGEAANGREAVNQAYRLQPDVVVMDVAMPLINGDDATRQIKLHLPQTRVLALSMYEEPDMVEKMRRAGAEAYILKTAPSEELLAAIRGKVHAGVTA